MNISMHLILQGDPGEDGKTVSIISQNSLHTFFNS